MVAMVLVSLSLLFNAYLETQNPYNVLLALS
jgi:hypothetical protein